jgi:hypothetical protein
MLSSVILKRSHTEISEITNLNTTFYIEQQNTRFLSPFYRFPLSNPFLDFNLKLNLPSRKYQPLTKHLRQVSPCTPFLSMPHIHTTFRRLLSSQHHLQTQNIPSKTPAVKDVSTYPVLCHLTVRCITVLLLDPDVPGLPLATSLCSQCPADVPLSQSSYTNPSFPLLCATISQAAPYLTKLYIHQLDTRKLRSYPQNITAS